MVTIAPAVLSVLELFKGPLAGMRFADVDAEGLAALVAQVDSAGIEVADAEAKLAELQQALAVQQDALLALTQRALAYARVYAESREELLAELNAISLPRPQKPRKASAPKPSDSPGAPPSSVGDVQLESVATDVESALSAESLQARAVELDSERSEVDDAPVVSPARKSRRAGLLATKATA